MTAIVVELIGVAGLIVVAVLQVRAEQERKRRRKAEDERDKLAIEQRKADLEMGLINGKVLIASGELAYVTSLAVTGGQTNGNVEEAQQEFRKARKAYDSLEAELAERYRRQAAP